MTFNLLFNKGLLVQNNTSFKITFSSSEYRYIANYFEKLKTNYNIKTNMNFNALEETKNNRFKYEIDGNFWYLDISENKEIFLKNIYSLKKVKEGYEINKSIGYLILLIEERKFSNSADIYYSLFGKK
ncbi:hypothetical protein CRU95_14495 [Arcobacter sp. F2176]|nr:hypothetical protein CRU95_14495 [Arcobacter sp. F2176]